MLCTPALISSTFIVRASVGTACGSLSIRTLSLPSVANAERIQPSKFDGVFTTRGPTMPTVDGSSRESVTCSKRIMQTDAVAGSASAEGARPRSVAYWLLSVTGDVAQPATATAVNIVLSLALRPRIADIVAH